MAAGSFLREEDKILLLLDDEADSDLAARQLYRIGLDGIVGWITALDGKSAGVLSATSARIDFADFDPVKARLDGEIVDVRTTAEFEQRHLEGAHSLPYTRMRQLLTSLPRDRTLYVHCASGKRAALATSFLRSQGFTAIHVDGMFASCGKRCSAR
jgi:hydroxyacylglutathione hydrolase